jgi:NAD(P)-dependent dehydrogenase (short-subunit alcohol dehydrogenase family)
MRASASLKYPRSRNQTEAEPTAQDSSAIAIITSGSRGLGRSTVLSLAKRGIDSIFTYQSYQSEAEKVTELVADSGRRAIALQLDTGNVKTFDSFVTSVRQALAKLGTERFDYLINNAGTSLHKNFDQTTEEELDAIYNVHFKGVYFLTQKLLPLIDDGGRIVNISSGLARFSLPGSSAYGSMKGASLRDLSDCVPEGRHDSSLAVYCLGTRQFDDPSRRERCDG